MFFKFFLNILINFNFREIEDLKKIFCQFVDSKSLAVSSNTSVNNNNLLSTTISPTNFVNRLSTKVEAVENISSQPQLQTLQQPTQNFRNNNECANYANAASTALFGLNNLTNGKLIFLNCFNLNILKEFHNV